MLVCRGLSLPETIVKAEFTGSAVSGGCGVSLRPLLLCWVLSTSAATTTVQLCTSTDDNVALSSHTQDGIDISQEIGIA